MDIVLSLRQSERYTNRREWEKGKQSNERIESSSLLRKKQLACFLPLLFSRVAWNCENVACWHPFFQFQQQPQRRPSKRGIRILL